MTVPYADGSAADRRSLHERTAADLRAEIMSGDLAPSPSRAVLRTALLHAARLPAAR